LESKRARESKFIAVEVTNTKKRLGFKSSGIFVDDVNHYDVDVGYDVVDVNNVG